MEAWDVIRARRNVRQYRPADPPRRPRAHPRGGPALTVVVELEAVALRRRHRPRLARRAGQGGAAGRRAHRPLGGDDRARGGAARGREDLAPHRLPPPPSPRPPDTQPYPPGDLVRSLGG